MIFPCIEEYSCNRCLKVLYLTCLGNSYTCSNSRSVIGVAQFVFAALKYKYFIKEKII